MSEEPQRQKSTTALVLAIIGAVFFWFPLLPLALLIPALIKGHRGMVRDKEDTQALAALIIAWIATGLQILNILMVFPVLLFQFWIVTHQQGLAEEVESMSTSSNALRVERLESDGNLYIRSRDNATREVMDLRILENDAQQCIYSGSALTLPPNEVVNVELSGCSLEEDSAYTVELMTNKGVHSNEATAR